MLRACVFGVLVGLALSQAFSQFSDTVPETPVVIEYSHSAKISVNPELVPDGVDRVQIRAKEVNDLTGDVYEKGYFYGYNEVVTDFYYPQLKDAKYHVFKIKYGRAVDGGVEWSQFSRETAYHHSDASRFYLVQIKRDWPDARDECIKENSRLAVVSSRKANNVVAKLLVQYHVSEAWIGLYDKNYANGKPSATWAWVDSSPFRFSNFEYGAVDEDSEVETSGVAINNGGEWETLDPKKKLFVVCELGKTEKSNAMEARVGMSQDRIIA